MHASERPVALRRSAALARAPWAGRLGRSIAALATVSLAFAPGAAAAGPSASPTPTTPIEHVVVLMQENHTFDNYFGTYPGANGPPASACMPRDPTNPSAGCVAPFHLPSRRTVDLSHGTEVAAVALNNGKLDGFISAQNRRNLPGETAMGYYDGSDLPFYWNLASTSVLADRFFSSDVGGSKENHMFWVSGQAGDPSVPANGYTFDTIFDRLQALGIDWKFYVQNYDPSITFRNLTGDAQDSQTIWVPLLNFDRFIDDPALSSRIVDVSQYHEDLANGTLPAVAFIAPSGASEHPPGDVAIGQVYGASQIMALMESSSWASSLFVLTWDDWGGWYDHVLPPTIDANGYGMRVPALFVSPYAPAGRIDSTTYDFTSILRFIEDNWRLQPMTARDAAANSVGTTLDFSSAPHAPILPGPVYPDDAQPNPRARVALLGIYGAVILAIPAGVWFWWRRRPWIAPATEEPTVGAGLRPAGAAQNTGAAALAGHVLPRLTSAGMVTPVAVHDGGPRSVATIPGTPIPMSPPARLRAAASAQSAPIGRPTDIPEVVRAPARGTRTVRRTASANATVAEPTRGAGTKAGRKNALTTAAQIRVPAPIAAPTVKGGAKAPRQKVEAAIPSPRGKPGRATTPVTAPAPIAAPTVKGGAKAPRQKVEAAIPARAPAAALKPDRKPGRATTLVAAPAPVPMAPPAKGGRSTAATMPRPESIPAPSSVLSRPSRAKPIETAPDSTPAGGGRVKRNAPARAAPDAGLRSPDATGSRRATAAVAPKVAPARTTATPVMVTKARRTTAPRAATTPPVTVETPGRTTPSLAMSAGSAAAPAPTGPKTPKSNRTIALPPAPIQGRKRAPSTREEKG